MIKQIKHRVVKFPENRNINAKLQEGDRVIIAEKAHKTPGYIRDILMGYRRMTDEVASAIIELLNTRNQIFKNLEEITNQ